MNDENLVNFRDRTENERRELAKKAGQASGRSRREKRDLRRAFEALMEQDLTDENGEIATGTEAMAIAAFRKALRGDLRAIELIRDTVGQKPVEKVMIAEIDQDVIDEVEKAVLSDDSPTST